MADASHPAPDTDDADDGAGRERGFFGRIFDALSAPDGDDAPSGPPAREAPSLGALRRMRVEDVAVPKSDVVAVPATVGLGPLVEVFRASGRTRLPVYDGSLDAPLGLVNLKDVALRHGFGAAGPFDLPSLLRPLLYVPPSMPLVVLLQRMQAERIHMALVIDEYGGTDGLCTIEDLLETVVGDIADEHDRAAPAALAPETEGGADGAWVAEGGTPLADFEHATGFDLAAHEEVDAADVDTLGGLVLLLSGRVPRPGEVVEHPGGPRFEVLDADTRRIRRLRVRLPTAAPPPPSATRAVGAK